MGSAQVLDSLPTQRLFVSLGQLVNTSAETARLAGFAALALLLEVCALAMISVSSPASNPCAKPGQTPETTSPEGSDKGRSERARLLRDILSGAIEPVIRKIKMAGYQLSLPEIKDLLDDLKSNGVLEDDKRNSYQLAMY